MQDFSASKHETDTYFATAHFHIPEDWMEYSVFVLTVKDY